MKNNLLSGCTLIATHGPLGYLPAGGTIATVHTLLIMMLLHNYVPSLYSSSALPLTLAGSIIIWYASRTFHDKDPRQIVLDESIGFLWALYALPYSWVTIVGAFVLFRFFDILKPLGISYVERLPGFLGIVADDMAAGLLANGIMRMLLYSGVV